VKASAQRIVVFALTRFAHFKNAHRRVRAVVRNVFDNCKARSAIRAVDKGITKPPVISIEHFAQAIVANAHIRGNERVFVSLNLAFGNIKIVLKFCGDFFTFD
jgi:hypothetical protein